MRTAIISPIPELKTFGFGDFHLLLNHLLSNREYKDHYRAQSRSGAYLVLDNSAHEFQAGTDVLQLLTNAREIGAHEVVIPDVLFDGRATLDRSGKALDSIVEDSEIRSLFEEVQPRVMLVPQGKNIEDWITCLSGLYLKFSSLSQKHKDLFQKRPVIGLSKDYEMWDGGLLKLIEDHLYIYRGRECDIHLLGWGRQLWKLPEIARFYPWIRSTDSAKPLVYARHDIRISAEEAVPEYPTRPKDFFTTSFSDSQRDLGHFNINTFREAAAGSSTRVPA